MLPVKADLADDFESELTPAELGDLRRLVGFMVPSSADYRVPGANDGAIPHGYRPLSRP
jgi:hypothetical protein